MDRLETPGESSTLLALGRDGHVFVMVVGDDRKACRNARKILVSWARDPSLPITREDAAKGLSSIRNLYQEGDSKL